MRRIIHYLTLAAVLVGLPLGCAWLGGYDEVLADVFEIAPQCEKWVNDLRPSPSLGGDGLALR